MARARDLGATVLAGPVDLRAGRARLHRPHAGLRRRRRRAGRGGFWGIVSAVIDEAALYRASGLGDPRPRARRGAPRPGRTDRRRRGRSSATPRSSGTDPVTAEVQPAGGRLADRGGARRAAGGRRRRSGGRARSSPWRACWSWRRSSAPRSSSRRARRKMALIRDREAELSRLSWRLEFALAASEVGVWDVDLATDELLWDERTKQLFGCAGQRGAVQRGGLGERAAPRRPRADGRGGERRGRRRRPLRRRLSRAAAGRHGAARARHGAALPGQGRSAAAGRARLGHDARRRAAGGAQPAPARGRGGDDGEVALPRRHEPRDPHADERRPRPPRADARRSAARAAAGAGEDRARLGAEPAADPERHPRLLQARGAADPHQRGERRRPPADRRGDGADGGARQAEGPRPAAPRWTRACRSASSPTRCGSGRC